MNGLGLTVVILFGSGMSILAVRLMPGILNPGKINIAEANVSLWKGFVKLFIKLQDKGYPGSPYTLYYYPEKDALAGFYYQAAIGQTYEVVFLRKKVQ